MTGKIAVKRGSGNVFADLGLDHPEDLQIPAVSLLRRKVLHHHSYGMLYRLRRYFWFIDRGIGHEIGSSSVGNSSMSGIACRYDFCDAVG
jgi:hypothetical protein